MARAQILRTSEMRTSPGFSVELALKPTDCSLWLWDHAATSMRNGMVGRLCSTRAPGTTQLCKRLFSEEVYLAVGSEADFSAH
jgi:hypothetical protein